MFKPKQISVQIERELLETERMLLEAEGQLENAIGRRDTLQKRRDRLQASLGEARRREKETMREITGYIADPAPSQKAVANGY